MSRSSFCDLCSRDPDTGEFFCVRTGHWEARCPFMEDGTPWDAERETRQEEDGE